VYSGARQLVYVQSALLTFYTFYTVFHSFLPPTLITLVSLSNAITLFTHVDSPAHFARFSPSERAFGSSVSLPFSAKSSLYSLKSLHLLTSLTLFT
jgi:hypothetical protein